MIAESIHDGGTFLDVGCANGHLIECLDAWRKGSGEASAAEHGPSGIAEVHAIAEVTTRSASRRPRC